MTIKTLCMIKALLEEEVRNARDDYEEARANYKIAAESTDFADPLADREQVLEELRTIKRKLNERLTAAEDALDDFCGQNWK